MERLKLYIKEKEKIVYNNTYKNLHVNQEILDNALAIIAVQKKYIAKLEEKLKTNNCCCKCKYYDIHDGCVNTTYELFDTK